MEEQTTESPQPTLIISKSGDALPDLDDTLSETKEEVRRKRRSTVVVVDDGEDQDSGILEAKELVPNVNYSHLQQSSSEDESETSKNTKNESNHKAETNGKTENKESKDEVDNQPGRT